MKVAIINAYYPPNSSATGYYANVLADRLASGGADIHVYCTQGAYSSHDVQQPVGTVHRHTSLYKGTRRWRRLLSAFWSSLVLIARARLGRYDHYVVLSDPPFNNLLSAVILPSEQVTFWTMDLYPQAYVAAGLITERSWLYRAYQLILRRRRPERFITLGDRQAEYISYWIGPSEYITMPVGLRHDIPSPSDPPPAWADTSKTTYGYVGNVGEAHDDEFIYRVASELLDDEQMIYSGYGSKDARLRERLQGLPKVILLQGIPASDMHFIDVQLVTLLPQWTHICVPSKALTALQYGSAILYSGSEESDTWEYVRGAGSHFSKSNREIIPYQELTEGIVRTLAEQEEAALSSIVQNILANEQ